MFQFDFVLSLHAKLSKRKRGLCPDLCSLLFICAGLKFTGEIPVVPLQFIRSDYGWIKSSGEYAESLANANSVAKEENFHPIEAKSGDDAKELIITTL